MVEAERSIRARESAAVAAAQHRERSARGWSTQAAADLVVRVEALVPVSLEGLNRAGWPDCVLTRVARSSWFSQELAAAPAGGFSFFGKENPDERTGYSIYLLSDGRWVSSISRRQAVKAVAFSELATQFLGSVGAPGSLVASEVPVGVEEALERYARL